MASLSLRFASISQFMIFVLVVSRFGCLHAAERWSHVDAEGLLRWQDDGSEIALFGVNYYTPFTADYEGLQLRGENHRQTIDRDVAHFSRLGLDVIRLHVFDRQISDEAGNLIENVHLELFDYLVAVCKRRNISTVITPIAWWQYHHPDAGFSSKYTKPEMLTDPAARRAQRQYLKQFMQHVNPYTHKAYKDEPTVVAIELINEPLYDNMTTADDVRDYIDDLAGAVRSTGARQPIFYNGWSNKEESVGKSSIEGCTFSWYPTGLVSGGCLRSNYLPAVDDYPRMRLPCLKGKAKIVYEFDAADVPGRVMYPAMARAFRSGGAQIATQFQYDPTPLAAYNYGWCTHYLNLIYAPGKTLSFAIAAEAFRQTPLLAQFGKYPANTRFGPFVVDYERDLSVMRTESVYMYSNDTDFSPPAVDRLERVAGCGSSPVIAYGGTGAYFLDKLAAGQWLLTVYPDAVWVDDPFAPTSLEREVSRVFWTRRSMTLRLPDLGTGFHYRKICPSMDRASRADGRTLMVEPGVYVLVGDGRDMPKDVPCEFWAPHPKYDQPAVWWQAPARWREGVALPVQVHVAVENIEQVRLRIDDRESLPMRSKAPYVYQVSVPAARFSSGTLAARLEVQTADGASWFSHGSDAAAVPADPFTVCRVGPTSSVHLRGASGSRAQIVRDQLLRVVSPGFTETSADGLRLPAKPANAAYDTLVVRARAIRERTDRVEIGLVQADGKAYGTDLPLWPEWTEVRVPLAHLRPLWGSPSGTVDCSQLSEISLVVGAWLYGKDHAEPHGFEVEWVRLEQAKPGWQIDVAGEDEPLLLFATGDRRGKANGQEQRHQKLVAGSRPGQSAERIWTEGFGEPPNSISYRQVVTQHLASFSDSLNRCDGLEIVARATRPETNKLEVALVERDSTAWGTNVPLTESWQKIVVPLDQLRFFGHWDHAEGRGGKDDRLQLKDLAAVNFCFGAWLFGDQAGLPHGIEVESASLVRMNEHKPDP
jgi:hypothetical protein